MDTTTTPQRPAFKASGRAEILHLNVRKEGPDDNRIIAADLKLEIKGVDRAICEYFDEALAQFLWRHETEGLITRNAYLAPVAYQNEVSSAIVDLAGMRFANADVRKFKLQALDGGVITMTCTLSVYPNADDVAELAKRVQDETTVTIEGQAGLFDAPTSETKPIPSSICDKAEDPDLVEQARSIVIQHNKGSISLVQRHLKVGYNHAARLLEELERMGVVSRINSAGGRTVIVK